MDMIFNPALRSKAKINANDIHALDHFRFQRLYISEFTFYENGRRWIRILNKFYVHVREFCKYGREFYKYGRALHTYGRSFQKSCPCMRFFAFRAVKILNGYNLSG